MKTILLIIISVLIISASPVTAQVAKEAPLTRILFILDCSNSMNASWEKTKSRMDVARPMFSALLDSLSKLPNLEIALRMYGHQSPVPPQDCGDTKLEVPFSPNNIDKIKQKLWAASPKGTTPIARSLEACADDFPPCYNCRNIVILITDGIEACDGDPCAVALNLERKGIILKPYIIGIGLDVEFIDAFKCMANFYNASNSSHLKEIFDLTISETLVSTTAQVNLQNIYGDPKESNVNMTFYDSKTNIMKHNYMHTLNVKGLPDTLTLDPYYTYKIDVHTIPPVTIEDVKIVEATHNIIEAKTPQGQLLVKERQGNKLLTNKVQMIVRESSEYETLNVQYLNEPERYIIGSYDIEVLSLPRTYYYDVRIEQGKTTTVEIDEPGSVTLSFPTKGFSSLYKLTPEGQAKWVCNLNNQTRYSLLVQPGNYMAVFRAEKSTNSTSTVIRKFDVKSGFTQYIDF